MCYVFSAFLSFVGYSAKSVTNEFLYYRDLIIIIKIYTFIQIYVVTRMNNTYMFGFLGPEFMMNNFWITTTEKKNGNWTDIANAI